LISGLVYRVIKKALLERIGKKVEGEETPFLDE